MERREEEVGPGEMVKLEQSTSIVTAFCLCQKVASVSDSQDICSQDRVAQATGSPVLLVKGVKVLTAWADVH